MQLNMLGASEESKEEESLTDNHTHLPKAPFTDMVGSLFHTYGGWEGSNQFKGTAERLQKMFSDFCWTPNRINKELDQHTKLFEDKYEELMTISNIDVVTLCPHHLLPCTYSVDISYAPNGRVLGLSKFARIAVILGKRPIMQEMYTRELADTLYSRVNPIGVKVSVTGVHGCLMFRGAHQSAPVTTEQSRGTF